ncbi:AAA family ATPase [Micromonospora humida]|uniref:ATP-binding protein n=1 Tax=Micromonospora humida TaxID=2809018 RepID=A0ABS2IZ54_9ACTN|nr:AAA family ATPase [Micromonospora humida]MBM7079314.1 ATP-binding protein [Micromonospora humida]
MTNIVPRGAGFVVAEIYVKQLFGRYTYRIRSQNRETQHLAAPPLMLLYGMNGSGKTTILRLLWHLLSIAPNKGHRTAIATTPFRQFAVNLGNGTRIIVDKHDGLTGAYSISVERDGKMLARQFYQSPTEGHSGVIPVDTYRIPPKEVSDHYIAAARIRAIDPDVISDEDDVFTFETDDSYLSYLEYLGIKPVLLGDDRRLHADEEEPARAARYEKANRLNDELPVNLQLASSLSQTTEWLRQQLLSGAAMGSRGADEVYREVLTQLGRITELDELPAIDELRRRLISLDRRTKRFSDFGLATHFESKSMLGMLDSIPPSRLSLVASILDPYLTGQDARLDSLQATEKMVRTFVNYLNDYFDDKSVLFTPRNGIRIRSEDGNPIPPARLSSGERQLLLLLCRTVLSRQSTTLFMIDEPELSLNAKWQRRLVQTLLDLAEGSNVQFMMATHSIEIITRHRPYLAELKVVE